MKTETCADRHPMALISLNWGQCGVITSAAQLSFRALTFVWAGRDHTYIIHRWVQGELSQYDDHFLITHVEIFAADRQVAVHTYGSQIIHNDCQSMCVCVCALCNYVNWLNACCSFTLSVSLLTRDLKIRKTANEKRLLFSWLEWLSSTNYLFFKHLHSLYSVKKVSLTSGENAKFTRKQKKKKRKSYWT